MNISRNKIIYPSAILIVILIAVIFLLPSRIPSNAVSSDETVDIFPDYQGLTIPPNIAPLNFNLQIKSQKILAEFISPDGYSFIIESSGNIIDIPVKKWKKLLKKSTGKEYKFNIYVKINGSKWTKYLTYSNKVSEEKIDSHIVFRYINAGYILWDKMGIYQRNLENFKETPILLNDRTNNNCINCHSFGNYSPDKMMIHLRRPPGGTLLYNNNEIKFLNTSTPYTMSSCVYPSWHPGGKMIAYSVNIIEQKFHSGGDGKVYVYDKASDIVIYDLEKNIITTSPAVSTRRLENLPVWSPKGDYIYYINGPEYKADAPLSSVKYDLMGISYNPETNIWGIPDTILKASDTGLSISFPEVSPDGKFLVFCMSDYGYFTVHNNSSDLYIMNLETKEYNKLPVNSELVESYHSWSSGGRWMQFISKRLDGLYSRVYFCYINKEGKASKPFILPQKKPEYYSTLTINYNRPVFIKGEVRVSAAELSKKAFTEPQKLIFDPEINIDALSGASRITHDQAKEPSN